MHCETCKYWDRDEEDADGWGSCILSSTKYGEPVESASLCRAQDHRVVGAWLAAHRTFGCVQYAQSKEEAVWTCDATSGD